MAEFLPDRPNLRLIKGAGGKIKTGDIPGQPSPQTPAERRKTLLDAGMPPNQVDAVIPREPNER